MIKSLVRLAVIGLAVFGMTAFASPNAAQAALLGWNFGGGSSALSGPFGNTRTFTADDGLTTVNVTAFSLTGNSKTEWQTAFLGHFSSGLGVTNRNEGTGGNGKHTLDNVGSLDIMLFFFSKAVEPLYMKLVPFKTSGVGPDTDITVWIGNAPGQPDLTGDSLADVNNSFGPQINSTGHGSARWANIGDGRTGNVLLVAGQVSEYQNSTAEDGVKIKKLLVKTVKVPEPSALAVFAAGLVVLGVVMGRRRRATPKLR